MPHIEEGRLHAYLDGQLPAGERSVVDAHLATCAECRARLDEAERLARESGALLERLDPGTPASAPWSEIEARGAARSQRPRRSAWLDPRFTWAASIALAFAVGWLTRGTQIQRELAQYNVRMAAADSAAALSDEGELAVDQAQPLIRSSQGEPTSDVTAGARQAERPAEMAKAEPAPPERQVREKEEGALPQPTTLEDQRRDLTAEISQDAERDTGEKAAAPALERRARAFAAPGAAPSFRQRLEADSSPIMLEEVVVTTGDVAKMTALESELVGGASFFRAQPEVAETWLGAHVRTLPGHTLEKVEVGPGAAVRGGLRGRPVVRLVYKDTAGREITLLQQRDGADADDTTPALIVSPSGLRAYRWTDGEYVLTLAGPLSPDSLRALADRVR